MEIRFWGSRGSIPAPGPSTLEFGGNTTCLEVVLRSGRRIVIDGGTGIRLLGEHLKTKVATVRLHLLLTHNHWDHLIGLPFFFPIYREDSEIRIDGWPLAFQALKRVFDDHMGDGFFPVAFEDSVDLFRIEIVVQIAAHHHDRGMVTITQADHREQGKFAVRSGFTEIDPQPLVKMFAHPFVAHQPAGDAVA